EPKTCCNWLGWVKVPILPLRLLDLSAKSSISYLRRCPNPSLLRPQSLLEGSSIRPPVLPRTGHRMIGVSLRSRVILCLGSGQVASKAEALALVPQEEEVVEVRVDLVQVGVPFRMRVGVDRRRMVLEVP